MSAKDLLEFWFSCRPLQRRGVKRLPLSLRIASSLGYRVCESAMGRPEFGWRTYVRPILGDYPGGAEPLTEIVSAFSFFSLLTFQSFINFPDRLAFRSSFILLFAFRRIPTFSASYTLFRYPSFFHDKVLFGYFFHKVIFGYFFHNNLSNLGTFPNCKLIFG